MVKKVRNFYRLVTNYSANYANHLTPIKTCKPFWGTLMFLSLNILYSVILFLTSDYSECPTVLNLQTNKSEPLNFSETGLHADPAFSTHKISSFFGASMSKLYPKSLGMLQAFELKYTPSFLSNIYWNKTKTFCCEKMYVLTAQSHLLFCKQSDSQCRALNVNFLFLSNCNKYLNHKHFLPQFFHCWKRGRI